MAIVRWDPWAMLPRFWSRWPTLWDEEEWVTELTEGLTVYETDDEVVIKANVAGVPADKVDVSIEGGVVTIKAEHEESEEEKKKRKIVYKEARKAKYLYTTSLPCPVKADKAEAEVKDGILTITIPKEETAKPKKIKVKAKAGK